MQTLRLESRVSSLMVLDFFVEAQRKPPDAVFLLIGPSLPDRAFPSCDISQCASQVPSTASAAGSRAVDKEPRAVSLVGRTRRRLSVESFHGRSMHRRRHPVCCRPLARTCMPVSVVLVLGQRAVGVQLLSDGRQRSLRLACARLVQVASWRHDGAPLRQLLHGLASLRQNHDVPACRCSLVRPPNDTTSRFL